MDLLYYFICLAGAGYITFEISRRVIAYKVRSLIKKCKQFRLDENTQKAREHTKGEIKENFQKLIKCYKKYKNYEILVEISMYVNLIGFKLKKYVLEEDQRKSYKISTLYYFMQDLGLNHFWYSIMQIIDDKNDDAQLLRDIAWSPIRRNVFGLRNYFTGIEKSYFQNKTFWIDELQDWFDELKMFTEISKSGIPAVEVFQDTLAKLQENALLRINELLDDRQLSTEKLEIILKCVKKESFLSIPNYFETNTKFYEIYQKHQDKLKKIVVC